MIARSIEVPLKYEAKFLGKLYTDEGKGSNHITKLISKKQIENIKKIGIETTYQNISKQLMYNRTDYHWLYGIISLIDEEYLPMMKGFIKSYPNLSSAIQKCGSVRDSVSV